MQLEIPCTSPLAVEGPEKNLWGGGGGGHAIYMCSISSNAHVIMMKYNQCDICACAVFENIHNATLYNIIA